MKPEIIISSQDLERLEGLLHAPAARNRRDLDGLRAELERAQVREPEDMPPDVITMNSRARIREMPSGTERELTLVYPAHPTPGGVGWPTAPPAGRPVRGGAAAPKRAGPRVDGHVVHLEVLEVTSQPEARGDFDS